MSAIPMRNIKQLTMKGMAGMNEKNSRARVTAAVLEATTWNWGIGMWAIIYPVCCLPLIVTLYIAQRRAARAGVLDEREGYEDQGEDCNHEDDTDNVQLPEELLGEADGSVVRVRPPHGSRPTFSHLSSSDSAASPSSSFGKGKLDTLSCLSSFSRTVAFGQVSVSRAP
jgi:hypothetical protein